MSRGLSSKVPVLPFLEKQLAYVGGQWCKASDDTTFNVNNPANGDVLGSVANVGEVEAQKAVLEANKAFHIWKKTTVKVNHAYLRDTFIREVKNWLNIHPPPPISVLAPALLFDSYSWLVDL